jgi:hypothetical protein
MPTNLRWVWITPVSSWTCSGRSFNVSPVRKQGRMPGKQAQGEERREGATPVLLDVSHQFLCLLGAQDVFNAKRALR